MISSHTRREYEVINAIAERAVALAASMGLDWNKRDALMDIMAAHDAIPLKLDDLLAADNSNFAHDVFGINRHLNRQTLRIEDCFLPRFARPQQGGAA